MDKIKKVQGLGLGLRFPHFDDILNTSHNVPWFEVISDDFLEAGPHWDKLTKLRADYPIVLHSIGMNIGGIDPFDIDYLASLKNIYQIFEPEWISDHLCWSSHNGKYHHDLLPIPKTNEALKVVVERVNFLQDYFKRTLVLENVTQYIDFSISEMSEIEFIKEIVAQTDCKILLDITNVIINHNNRKKDYMSYFNNFPMDSVQQFHLAGGFVDESGLWIDSHTQKVQNTDLEVLQSLCKSGKKIAGIIERDGNLPSFEELEKERVSIENEFYEL